MERSEANREAAVLERVEAFRRRRPRLTDELVTTAHGAGGKASSALVDAVFLQAFHNDALAVLGDAAVLALPSGERIAFTTDSSVVQPLRFPGGSIGHLAVHGTVNDLAVSGAVPQWVSCAFVLEEGFPIADLHAIAADMAEAAANAGVQLVTGDTKVVQRGAADGCYITTAGVGLVPTEVRLGADTVQPRDQILLSGTIGDHGMAIMLARGELTLEGDLRSDTAPVAGLVQQVLAAAPTARWFRDPTRGGVATVLNELSKASQLGVELDELALPVRPIVNGACELLGIDPLYVANEGRVVAVVPPDEAPSALEAMQRHPLGADAAVVGEVTGEHPGMVVLRTGFGGSRIVDLLVGDPLPRIC